MEKIDCKNKRTVEMLYAKVGSAALSKTRYIVKGDAAEEIVQDAFVKLWQSQLVFENIRGAYAWIYKTCTNSAIDFLRKKDNQTIDIDKVAESESSYLGADEKLALRKLLSGFVDRLPDDEAQYFIYKFVDGLKQEEMVEVMGVSRRTIARLGEKVQVKLEKFKGDVK